MQELISGMLVTAYAVSALFFLKFWKRSGDRLFAIFAAAFCLLAVQRFALAALAREADTELLLYGLRAVAFVLIIVAIIDKNRAPDRRVG